MSVGVSWCPDVLSLSFQMESGDTGPIFIDRSPEHFNLILNYLRDEEVNLPDSEEDVREILKEADYYSLEDLVEQCKSKLPQDPSYTLKFLENDMDLLQITTTPEKVNFCSFFVIWSYFNFRLS